MAKVVGASLAVFHNPSPGFMRVTFSTNFTSDASGTLDGSWATSAARYELARSFRQARLHGSGAAAAAVTMKPTPSAAIRPAAILRVIVVPPPFWWDAV